MHTVQRYTRPTMKGITHRVAEERSLALHHEVARRLRARPELLDRARARVELWAREGEISPRWVAAWRDLLSQPLETVLTAITEDDEHTRSLRQTSPFAGVIDPRTRWEILRECEKKRRSRES